jgi:Polyketide cyclase / dehydrase and lipid transport
MQEIHGTATGSVNAAADPTFRLITDIERLPDWNRAIERVVEPAPDLSPGSEWVVKMHPSRGMSWQSCSRIEEIDSDTRRFRYRTWNTDGNPSYADWKWEVVPLESTAQVSVSWDVYLKTLDRKWLAGPIRQRQLRKEVAESLRALDRASRNA